MGKEMNIFHFRELCNKKTENAYKEISILNQPWWKKALIKLYGHPMVARDGYLITVSYYYKGDFYVCDLVDTRPYPKEFYGKSIVDSLTSREQ